MSHLLKFKNFVCVSLAFSMTSGGFPLGNSGLDFEVLGQDFIGIIEHIGSGGRHLLGSQFVNSGRCKCHSVSVGSQEMRQQVVDSDPCSSDFRATSSVVNQGLMPFHALQTGRSQSFTHIVTDPRAREQGPKRRFALCQPTASSGKFCPRAALWQVFRKKSCGSRLITAAALRFFSQRD